DRVEFEVHPSFACLYVAAGDLCSEVPPHHSGQGVQGGVGAHDLVPAVPVDDSLDRCAGIREFPGFHDVDDLAVAADRVCDPHLTAVPTDHTGVAGLSSSPGVEDGAVENHDSAPGLQHISLGPIQIAVPAGEFFD